MSRRFSCAAAALAVSVSPVMADVPKVVTDIAPIHSLVSQVMGDLGAPSLLMEQNASPHDYALRPSDARNLQQADAVFWVGSELTPWLDESIGKLASKAVSVELIETQDSLTLEFREGALFEHHVHGDGEGQVDHDHEKHDHDELAQDDHHEHADHHDHHDHDDHDGHAQDDHDDHEHHNDDESSDGHDHSGVDPHAWLDPQNAITWLGVISQTLSDLDPENAATYAQNAVSSQADLADLITDLQNQLEGERDMKFVVFHDAYHYFEARFGLSAMGAISLSDATPPSPKRIVELRNHIKEAGIDCVMSEPQFNMGLVDTVLEGTSAFKGVIDPLGRNIAVGAAFYGDLIQGVADSFDVCR
ncbi:zinc transport system substrate-binding protein [Pacificibacter maritimus]|uniref:High-affinity zinc uptake system protein ZnuA n=1 Tax=Pacificibacter maritimus TaxID=762213 RepID=A0A3N4UCY5_9RHOB|nr:zinc ABC transporter substrate-binding protein [Pacificibacter maritimus]RPE66295.1 zinc transport system substrate-binding protein [Pacificibacter maritimus]